jgi:hypothetical protein
VAMWAVFQGGMTCPDHGHHLARGAGPGRHQLAARNDLADALRALVIVLKEDGRGGVARSPRNRR